MALVGHVARQRRNRRGVASGLRPRLRLLCPNRRLSRPFKETPGLLRRPGRIGIHVLQIHPTLPVDFLRQFNLVLVRSKPCADVHSVIRRHLQVHLPRVDVNQLPVVVVGHHLRRSPILQDALPLHFLERRNAVLERQVGEELPSLRRENLRLRIVAAEFVPNCRYPLAPHANLDEREALPVASLVDPVDKSRLVVA